MNGRGRIAGSLSLSVVALVCVSVVLWRDWPGHGVEQVIAALLIVTTMATVGACVLAIAALRVLGFKNGLSWLSMGLAIVTLTIVAYFWRIL